MIRKIFKTGNSMVVSLPSEVDKQLGIRPGTEVEVQIDEEEGVIVIRPMRKTPAGVTSDFSRLVDEFIEEYRPVLEALAR